MAGNGKKTSSGSLAGVMVGTVAAIGGGFAFGAIFLNQPEKSAVAAVSPPKSPKAPEAEIKQLAPVVTNLANPAGIYVRMESAILLEPGTPEPAAIAAKVSDDFVVFLRTVSLAELQGPTGFQYLREDLKKRAIQRSGGKVRDFFLTSFVIE